MDINGPGRPGDRSPGRPGPISPWICGSPGGAIPQGDPAQLFSGGSGTAEEPPPSSAAAHEVVLHDVVIREDGVEGRQVGREPLGRSAALSDQRTVARGAQGPIPASPPIAGAPVVVPDRRVTPTAGPFPVAVPTFVPDATPFVPDATPEDEPDASGLAIT